MMWRGEHCYLKRIILFLVVAVVVFVMPASTYALTDAQMEFYAQNNILFYDPGANCVSAADVKGNSDGSDVYMIGDSITMNSENEIKNLMPNITLNMKGDMHFGGEGVERINEIGGQSILLFALGTNGGITQEDVEELLNATKGKSIKVILMTIYYGGGMDTEQMNSSNNIVKSLASQYGNITYLDWYKIASGDSDKYISNDNISPTDYGKKEFAKATKSAVDAVSMMNIPTNSGDRDYSRVLTAKNAEKDVFNVENYSEWSARWGDGNNEQMAKVLNNYGDLAYQLGDAVGAPWVAIVVQMRYEDPNSVCGHNNFWGNGCPSGTGAGGASIKASNLGEGFMKYGQTLTNGYHDQALGISDPKEYLEKIGPTWVQGDINGPGYASIDGMRKSVDALLEFIDSDEGQAIVKTFSNYHGTFGSYSAGMDICSESATIVWNGEPVFYQQTDPQWGSIPYDKYGCGTTIGSGGCGPTSLASIIATLTGDPTVTPPVIAQKALDGGYRACNSSCSCNGSYHSITNIATDYGLVVENIGNKPGIEKISNYLRQGWMFHIAGSGPEPFSGGGHFIAIRGITDDGKWLVFDSSHGGRNNTVEWDPEGIYNSTGSDWRGVHK